MDSQFNRMAFFREWRSGLKQFNKVAALVGILLLLPWTANASPFHFSGQVRVRPEIRDNQDFNKDTNDTSSFVGSRVRLTGIFETASQDVSAKVTLQDSRVWGQASAGGLTDSGESIDLHEGYFEVRHLFQSPLTLRVGRQELVYGDQRLVGSFDWSNQGRAFDAFKLSYPSELVDVDVWGAKRKENNAIAGSPDQDRDFYGIYSTFKKLSWAQVELYGLLDRENDSAPAVPNKSVYTIGSRLAGKVRALDFALEFPYQFGDAGQLTASSQSVKIDAYAVALKAGYQLNAVWHLGAEFDYASGDDNSADDRAKTFNNLYPTNHLHYGYIDYQAWRNMMAFNVNAGAKLLDKKLFVRADVWTFRLAQEKDGWYNAAGSASGLARAGSTTSSEKDVGRELDLTAKYAYNSSVALQTGISYFFAGKTIDQKVLNDGNSVWAYLSMSVKF